MAINRKLGLASVCLLVLLALHSVAQSLPPIPPASPLLDIWRFDDAPLWLSTHGYAPLDFTNIQSAPSFQDYSVQIDTNIISFLQYAILQDDGNYSMGIPSGTIFIWAQPNWSSASTNGTGPGNWATLLSIGSYLEGATASSNAWLSLLISPDGNTLVFASATNDAPATAHLSVPISWSSGDWHNVIVGFDETSSFFALDGIWVTNGPGIALGDAIISNAFYVGSTEGFWQFHGQLDALETWDRPATFDEVTNYYSRMYNDFFASGSGSSGSGGYSGFSAPGGLLPLSGCGCVTNGPAYMTNLSAVITNGVNFSFCVLGGTNGVGYDLWSATALNVPNHFANAWTWLGTVQTCTNYLLTNQSLVSTFYYLAANPAPCYPDTQVMFVMDRSTNMVDTTPSNNLQLAEYCASNIIHRLNLTNYDSAGLVTWSTNVATNQFLTNSLLVLSNAIASISNTGEQNTDASNAIYAAQAELTSPRRDPRAKPIIVFVSEGLNNGSDLSGTQTNGITVAANYAKSLGTRFIAVAIGEDAYTNFLKTLPANTNDFYWASLANTSSLTNVFNSIAASICRYTNAPTVQITNPPNNFLFIDGTNLPLNAVATCDAVLSISNVQFFADNVSLGSVTSSPFNLTWSNVPPGTHVIIAKASDNSGSTAFSVPVTITDQIPPPPNSVSFVSPTNGQLFVLSPTNILVEVVDQDFSVTALAIYNGSTKLFQTNKSPCLFVWTNVAAGIYTLTARATNEFGFADSASVTITNNAMPTVTITSPTNIQSYLEVTNVTITGNFNDPDGSVTNITLYSGTNKILSTNISGTTNFSLVWSNRVTGAYPIMAVATDNRGAPGISNTKVFQVNSTNTPPTVAVTYPTNNQVFAAGSDITITATATNGSGTVTNVEFFANEGLLGNDTNAPYSVSRCCWTPGTYTLTARATDSLGSSGVSTNISIIISGATINPANGFWDPLFGNPGDGNLPSYYTAVLAQSGTSLYMAGQIPQEMGGITSHGLIKWDGANFTNVYEETGLSIIRVTALAIDGTNFYFASSAHNSDPHLMDEWNGTEWVSPATNSLGVLQPDGEVATYGYSVYAVAIIGSDLYIGGDFTATDNNTNVQYIARLNRSLTRWEPVGNGLNGAVYTIAALGNQVFAGGIFTNAGGNTNASFIAALNGNVWTNLASGVGGTNSLGLPGGVYGLKACGSNLFVGGEFTSAGGNTNANAIAVWNGDGWATIQSGLAGSEVNGSAASDLLPPGLGGSSSASVRVSTISTLGNTIFVGGEFTGYWQGTNQIPATNIAEAIWSEANQAWTWTALDNGVTWNGEDNFVTATAIMPGSSTNSYDLFVAGKFDAAGSALTPSYGVARWSVGRPYPTNAPAIGVTYPAYGQVFTDPSSITFSANASGPTNINSVQFFVDGASIGSSSDTANPYTETWTPTNGSHVVTAVVNDVTGMTKASAPVVFLVKSVTNVITASNDVFTLVANCPATYLPVLTNDFPSTGLRISYAGPSFSFGNSAAGMVSISEDKQYVIYTPTPNLYGTNLLVYNVTNSSGAAGQALVTVNVVPRPVVQITQPRDGTVTSNTASVTIGGTATSWDGAITNVLLFTNGVQYGAKLPVTSSNTFSTNWTQSVPGYYTFTAVATDSDGITNVSAPVTIAITNSVSATDVITAAITYPLPAVTNLNGYLLTNAVLIRGGVLTNTGSAYDSTSTNTVAYEILLLDPTNPNTAAPLYNITPAPRNAEDFHSGAVTNGTLGVLDLSLVENGTYQLTLLVRGGGKETTASVLIAVASNLKLGQFSFSQQDLTLPVNGLPLTLTRTYNSINPRSGDFGYGWTFALNAMDVQLDEQRVPVTIGSDAAPDADVEEDDNGLPLVVSIRTGGSRDVTLTLPDGRRTTFAFNPQNGATVGQAVWTPPPEIGANITLKPMDSGLINYFPALSWASAPQDCTFDAYDVPGWILQTQDGTQYKITRGVVNNVTYDVTGEGDYSTVPVYGPPQLTEIDQKIGDRIVISSTAVAHYSTNSSTPTRSIQMDRDGEGRITAIYDPSSQAAGPQSSTFALQPTVRYLYDNDSGNLVQVLKLVDRVRGTYTTNKYHYDNPNFPHYITSIDDANGATPVRTLYNDVGQMVGTIDAFGHTNTFTPNLAAQSQTVIDALGNTNTFFCDTRGNVTTTIDTLGHVTQKAYDASNNVIMTVDALSHTNFFGFDGQCNQIASTNALGYTNGAVFDTLGHMLTNTDARGFSTVHSYDPNTGNLLATIDALSNANFNFYNSQNLLAGTRDPLGTVTTNYFDSSGNGNLIATATLSTNGAILATNSFACDANGNRTNSTVWHRVNGVWTGAATTYILDAQNRVTQTINPDGGTNVVIFDNNGRPIITIDPLGHGTTNVFDDMGRQIGTLFADGSSTFTTYDANGGQIATTNQLGYITQYFHDAVGRQTTVVYPDLTTNLTVFDAAGRVRFTIDARGFTNAPGYDALGQQTSMTNALGTPQQMVTQTAFDGSGNQTSMVDALLRTNSYVVDALNRVTTTIFPDGNQQVTVFDAAGRKVSLTDQATNTTLFGLDGIGNLTTVTNALGKITAYGFDEAGNQTTQVDALNRQTKFEFDGMGRRTKRTLPGGQSETFGYDLAGNEIAHTNFNGLVLTNAFDAMNRLKSKWNAGTQLEGYLYDLAGELTNRTDTSGAYGWILDNRGRVRTNSTPVGTLYNTYDANGNQTGLSSATPGGVSLTYQIDSLNRITNVIDNSLSGSNTVYGYDQNGNFARLKYPNGVTNQCSYDVNNRLTNLLWKLNGSTLANFGYQLGPTGNRKVLQEVVGLTSPVSRTNTWTCDTTYRLTNETVAASSGPDGNVGYALDDVGNRLSRASTLGGVGNQSLTYGTNDWLGTDGYDSDGNTITNAGIVCHYDYADRLTNFNNGAVIITYAADGNRIKKVTATATNLYLVATVNPTGYPQVVEELIVSGGTTNLGKAYSYGLGLICQRIPGTSTNYFVADGHGSTRLLLDSGANVVNAFAFDAYGILIVSNSTPQTMYLQGGEQSDPDLGLYYHRARYGNPNTGRFQTMDSLEGDDQNPNSLNLYTYCEDTPVDRVDPSGHEDVATLLSAIGDVNSLANINLESLPTVDSCGPDITAALQHTLVNVSQTFLSAPLGLQLQSTAGALPPFAADGWDIDQLADLGFGGKPNLGNGSLLGFGRGDRTVQLRYDGKERVYLASAVNYAMWGRMYRLLHDRINDRDWTERMAAFWARSYNAVYWDEWISAKADEVSAFVRYGYDGTDPSSSALPLPTKPKNVAASDRFQWRWYGLQDTYQ